MVKSLNILYRFRYTILELTKRDLKNKYGLSVFGYFWMLLIPISMLLIYWIVFGVILKLQPDTIYQTENFFLFLFTGILPWQFFSQAITSSTSSIVTNKNLVKKAVGFPSEIISIASTTANLISHILGLVVLVFILAIIDFNSLFGIVFLIPYLMILYLMILGISYIVSSLNVFLRDIAQSLNVIMLAWFYVTPILYSPSMLPESLRAYMEINPMFHIIHGYRMAMLTRSFPDAYGFFYATSFSVLVLVVGYFFFKKLKNGFAEVL